MSKSNYSISRKLHEDLMKAYCDVCEKSLSQLWSQRDAYARAVLQPAPRYYVSPKQAHQVLAPMFKGDYSHVDKMKDARRRMYYSLYNRVIELSQKRAFIGKSLWQIIPYAVNGPAPEFFIGVESIRKMRRFIKKNRFSSSGRICVDMESRRKAYEKLKEKRVLSRQYPHPEEHPSCSVPE